MTDDRSGKELSDSELHAYLQSRIPAPGAGYWDQIDSQLHAAESRAADPGLGSTGLGGTGLGGSWLDGSGDADEAPGQSADTDDNAARLTSMKKAKTSEIDAPSPAVSSWLTNRNLLAVAALVLIVGFGTFAVVNRSGDDTVDLATASQGQTDGDAAAQTGATGNATDIERDLSPLRALQARLAGQVTGVDEAGAGTAGPYCFTSEDAYVFPADELQDRRALARLDVTVDGTVNYAALQGDTIAISGSGIPTATGVLMSRPIAFGAASGDLPPYEITITDTSVRFAPENAVLDLVPCASVQDRIDTMFSLPLPATLDPVGASADWPTADAILSSAGLGPIKVGMTVSELSTVVGSALTIDTIDLPGAGECGWVADSPAISNGVWIIVELTSATDAIVRRVSVSDGRWSTPSGISVGMTEQNVIDTFPNQIESTPHVYVEGTYMTYLPASDSDPNTVQFVNEGGTIVQMHAGDRAWVGLVEGCA